MKARDYRALAREALRGKWLKTALLMLLALILGAGSASTAGLSFGGVDFSMNLNGTGMDREAALAWGVMATLIWLGVLAFSLFLGSYVRVGMVNMLDRVLDGEDPHAEMLFPRDVYWRAVKMNLLRNLHIFLWSLLLVIPGIIAAYRYTMADILLLKHPEMSAAELLQESKRCMQGRKARLFCLELSFIGWAWLTMLPVFVIVFAIVMPAVNVLDEQSLITLALMAFAIGGLLTGIAELFLQSYMNTAVVAFYRDCMRSARWQDEAREGAEHARETYAASSFLGQTGPVETVLSADETVARDMFFDYSCSRRRMCEAGVLEDYDALNASPISQERWKRDYGGILMRRFDHDGAALDDILSLAAEYAMTDLIDRALSRIERHLRQQTLPDGDILNMCGCVLALLVSGVFADDAGFVQRKTDQISDMADRLEHRLTEANAEGDWREALRLIRQMCK